MLVRLKKCITRLAYMLNEPEHRYILLAIRQLRAKFDPTEERKVA